VCRKDGCCTVRCKFSNTPGLNLQNTTFWERLAEFPEVLTEFPKQPMKRDKEETAFPKFVGHCVVDGESVFP
jgi:hypothetical protein